jgi:hypothetical protein
MVFGIGTGGALLAESRQIAVAFCESFVIQRHPFPIVRKFSAKSARYSIRGFFCQQSAFANAFPSVINDVRHDYPDLYDAGKFGTNEKVRREHEM